VRRALQAPVRQIAENAGFDGAVVAGRMLGQKDVNFGFDAQKAEYVNMIKAGVIDPTKVVPHGAPGRGVGGRASGDDRGDGGRSAGQECATCNAGWRHGR
jgi:hypothetical protein